MEAWFLYGFRMKMTFDIDQSVIQALREEAARRGLTVSALVEAWIRRLLVGEAPADAQTEALPPMPTWRSGGIRIDIDSREALYRAMEDE